MTDALTCPKCGSAMRNYERNRIVVDQCTGCGGLFLDHGELERLVEAESVFYSKTTPPPSHEAPPPHAERREHRSEKPKKQKGARSFLEDFLEI